MSRLTSETSLCEAYLYARVPLQVLDLPEAEPARAGPSNAVLSSEVPAAPIGGPYVFIPAAKFKAPLDDAQLVDARQLRVAGEASRSSSISVQPCSRL